MWCRFVLVIDRRLGGSLFWDTLRLLSCLVCICNTSIKDYLLANNISDVLCEQVIVSNQLLSMPSRHVCFFISGKYHWEGIDISLHSVEWTILSHVTYFIRGEVIGFHDLLDSLHPHSTRASWWSPPVLQGASC